MYCCSTNTFDFIYTRRAHINIYNICNAIMKMNACFTINNSVILETKLHTRTQTNIKKIFETFMRANVDTKTSISIYNTIHYSVIHSTILYKNAQKPRIFVI